MALLRSYSHLTYECGTDEAGRGCLAGPVTAAAVVLTPNYKNEALNDSKQMSASSRLLHKFIIEENALDFGVAFIHAEEIDHINILQASIKAMHTSLDHISLPLDYIIVDGNKFKPYKNFTHECIIKGDSKFMSIAAASVLAKTYRDELMNTLHLEFPMYNWKQNKGS